MFVWKLNADSRAICRYVAEKYADRGNKYLLGRDLLERASIEQWLKLEEQSFNPPSWELILYIAFGPHINNSAPDRALITQSEQKLAKVLDIYEQRLSQSRYLAGDEFTLADLNHLPNSYYLATTGYRDYLFDERTNVKRWFEDISDRPSWTKVVELMTEETGLKVHKEPTAIEKDASKPRKPSIEVKKDVASRQKPEKVFLVPPPTSLVSLVSPPAESVEPRSDTPQDVAPTTPEKVPTFEQATKVVPPIKETATAREASAQPALEAPTTPRAAKPSTQPPPTTSAVSAKPRYDTPPDVAPTTPEKAATSKQPPDIAPPTKETVTTREASTQPALEAPTPQAAKPSTQPPPPTPPTESAGPRYDTPQDVAPTTPGKVATSKQPPDVAPPTKETATTHEASTQPALGAQTPQAAKASTQPSPTTQPTEQVPTFPQVQAAKEATRTTQSELEGATSQQQNVTEQFPSRPLASQTATQPPKSISTTKPSGPTARIEQAGAQQEAAAKKITGQTSEKSQLADKITGQEVEEAAAQSKKSASTTDKSTTETTSSSQTAMRTKSSDNTATEQVQAQEKSTPSLIPSDLMVNKEAADQSKKSVSTTEKSFMEKNSYSQTGVRRESTDNTITDKSTTKTATSSQMATRTETTDKTTTEQAQSQGKSTLPLPPTDESKAQSLAVSQPIAERQRRDQMDSKTAPQAPDDSKEPASSDTQSSSQTTNNSKRGTAALTNGKTATETIQTSSLSNGELSSYKTSTSETSKESLSTERAHSQEAQKAVKSITQSAEPASSTGKSSPETRTPSERQGQTPSISETTGTRTQSGVAHTTESTQSPNSGNFGAKTDTPIDSNSKWHKSYSLSECNSCRSSQGDHTKLMIGRLGKLPIYKSILSYILEGKQHKL
ncbi:Glutathione S-transferase F11 [Ananas comosus]|uniref:glutathione transferase n=1 Tax=Ananas comosus TaxID=4615 RepID=A0A199UFW3_ANACO|nr:Glutathione S-transferase F11 [Ananas comosus]